MQRTHEQQLEQQNRLAIVAAIEDAGGRVIADKKVKCPFHEDAHPSAAIKPGQDGVWRLHCYAGSCGFHGDIYDIRARAEGRSLPDVLKESRGASAASRPTSPGPAAAPSAGPVQAPTKPTESEKSHDEVRRYPSIEAIRKALPHVELISAVQDEAGNPLYYEVRFHPDGPGTKKSICRGMPCQGAFILKSPNPPYLPFNLPEVVKAKVVVLVEGPKKMEALRQFGIVATSPYGGAGPGKARLTVWKHLRGKRVLLWPDGDEGGTRFMEDIAEILWNFYPRPQILWIAPASLGLGDKQDVIDYLAHYPADQQHEKIVEALDAATPWTSKRANLAAGVRQNTLDIISGKLVDARLPWDQLTRLSRLAAPDLLSLIVAWPGQLKTWFILHGLMYWFERDIPFAYYGLEEDRTYVLERIEAIREGNSDLLDEDFVREHPDVKLAADERQEPYLNAIGQNVWDAPNEQQTLAAVADWIRARASEGRRIIIVDPITATAAVKDCYITDRQFVAAAKTIARLNHCTVIISTHGKGGVQQRRLDGIAGGMAYPQLCQTCVWLEKHEAPKGVTVMSPAGRFKTKVDLTVHIQKARKARGAGKSLGYRIDWKTMEFAEQGMVLKQQRQRDAGEDEE
jgi:KaiC/GvpD/RAD55 family RecA-like ATPase